MTAELDPSHPADEVRGILAELDERPTLSRIVGAGRRLDGLHAQYPDLFNNVAALVVRNFTIEPIEPLVKVAAYRVGMHLHLDYSGYDPALDEALESLIARGPDVVLLALRLEELAPALTQDFLITPSPVAVAEGAVDRVVALARGIRARSRAAILVHNFASPVSPAAGLGDSQNPHGQLNLVRRMNVELTERVAEIDGAFLVDVDHLFAQIGLRQSHDDRGGRVSDAPLTQAALRALADAEVRHIRALKGPAVKCVVVDCDNTLWGGVVGEDGLAGLLLGETGAGRRHRDLQRTLLDLRRRGVVLAINSKNNEADVLEVLRSHPDCLVSEADFAARRINWDDKADNLLSLAKELNLGLEHMVFVDDNPVECEWITARLPAVRVVLWPGDLGDGGTLDDLGLFDSLVTTDEDRNRTEMYQSESQRRAARDDMASVDDYLRSLQIVATIGLAHPEQVARLAQLTQRTNQFNLTTRRYDVAAIEAMIEDPDTAVVWLDLRDRFGSSGVVGCGIVRHSGDVAVIDTLLLSCRVLGRHAETVILNRLATLAAHMGATTLIGEYIPSDRNEQVADLFGRLGFEPVDDALPGHRWQLSIAAGPPPVPDWFEVVDAGRGPA